MFFCLGCFLGPEDTYTVGCDRSVLFISLSEVLNFLMVIPCEISNERSIFYIFGYLYVLVGSVRTLYIMLFEDLAHVC